MGSAPAPGVVETAALPDPVGAVEAVDDAGAVNDGADELTGATDHGREYHAKLVL